MAQTSTSEPVAASIPLVNGEDSLYEVVNGERVEKPFMSVYGIRIAFVLASYLESFARKKKRGRVVVEAIFNLPLPEGDRQRRPDAAFVSYQRWAKDRPLPHTDPWPVVPNLAIEAISKNDAAEEIQDKLEEYFAVGVQLVWVIYPKQRLIYMYKSPTRPKVLSEEQQLDGGSVLPGFKLPVAAIFEEGKETPAESGQ
jgi:Uma2 family endonuclease